MNWRSDCSILKMSEIELTKKQMIEVNAMINSHLDKFENRVFEKFEGISKDIELVQDNQKVQNDALDELKNKIALRHSLIIFISGMTPVASALIVGAFLDLL